MVPPKKKETAPEGAEEVGFDERLARLEALVAELEEGGLGLEPAIDRYQEGVALLRDCKGVLDRYRSQVEELTRGAEDALRPFEGDPDADVAASGPGPGSSGGADADRDGDSSRGR